MSSFHQTTHTQSAPLPVSIAQQELDTAARRRNNRWYPQFHIANKAGKTSQPFGLCYFREQWHVFFQCALDPQAEEAPYFGHVSSEDLVYFTQEPLLLGPDINQNYTQVTGGSAVVGDDDRLWVFYTTARGDTEPAHDSVCAVISDDGIRTAETRMLFACPDGYRSICNPKVSRINGHWVMVVGASTDDHRGQIITYSSEDLRVWHFDGVLYQHPNPGVATLESPDFFSLQSPDGHDAWVLSFCTRGEHPNGFSKRNLCNAGYIIGDYTADGFIARTEFRMWDWGHNFYAPTTTLAPDGRRLQIAWMSSFVPPVVTSLYDGWCDQLTCVRQITLDEYHCLRINPVRELQSLRAHTQEFGPMCLGVNQITQLTEHIEAAEIILDIDLDQSSAERPGINVHCKEDGHCSIYYDKLINRVVLDRAANPFGDRGYRAAPFTSQRLRLHILLDSASVEVFVNDGEQVLSSYSLPYSSPTGVYLSSESGTMVVEHITIHALQHAERK